MMTRPLPPTTIPATGPATPSMTPPLMTPPPIPPTARCGRRGCSLRRTRRRRQTRTMPRTIPRTVPTTRPKMRPTARPTTRLTRPARSAGRPGRRHGRLGRTRHGPNATFGFGPGLGASGPACGGEAGGRGPNRRRRLDVTYAQSKADSGPTSPAVEAAADQRSLHPPEAASCMPAVVGRSWHPFGGVVAFALVGPSSSLTRSRPCRVPWSRVLIYSARFEIAFSCELRRWLLPPPRAPRLRALSAADPRSPGVTEGGKKRQPWSDAERR